MKRGITSSCCILILLPCVLMKSGLGLLQRPELPEASFMASADRGRACLEAVRVAGQLLREWGDDLVALATTNGGDDLIDDAREVCRSMLSRLEGISGRIEEVQDTRREVRRQANQRTDRTSELIITSFLCVRV